MSTNKPSISLIVLEITSLFSENYSEILTYVQMQAAYLALSVNGDVKNSGCGFMVLLQI